MSGVSTPPSSPPHYYFGAIGMLCKIALSGIPSRQRCQGSYPETPPQPTNQIKAEAFFSQPRKDPGRRSWHLGGSRLWQCCPRNGLCSALYTKCHAQIERQTIHAAGRICPIGLGFAESLRQGYGISVTSKPCVSDANTCCERCEGEWAQLSRTDSGYLAFAAAVWD